MKAIIAIITVIFILISYSSQSKGDFTVSALAETVAVNIPDSSAVPGDTISIPIRIETDLTGLGVYNVAIRIRYDHNTLSMTGDTISVDGTIVDSLIDNRGWFSPSWEVVGEGILFVSMAGISPLNGKGILLHLLFRVLPTAEVRIPTLIEFDMFEFNEGNPPAKTIDGVFLVEGSIIIRVPSDFPTIQLGLNAAIEGDSVLVAPGTYYENIFWPDVNGIRLLSEAGSESTIIDGKNTSSVLYFSGIGLIDSTTLIKGFWITHGGNVTAGGGFYCNYSSPIISNCIITDNSAAQGGGICCWEKSSPNLYNCTITKNTATEFDGGGIFCSKGSNPTISKCIIIENVVASYGTYGGGISCSDSSSPNISNCCISNNSVPLGVGGGGVSCFNNSDPNITNCTITENSAGGSGGGIFSRSSNPIFFDCDILDNSVTSNGGGLFFVRKSCPILTYCTISNNTVLSSDGGGICCQSGANPNITNCAIILNSAVYGGGISCVGSNPYLTNCEILYNIASWHGGGISCEGYANPNFHSCIINGNRVSNSVGGGIYCYEDSNPILTNCMIINNSAATHGGGIYCKPYQRRSNPQFTNCTIANNLAEESGGGVYCGGDMVLSHCTISFNLATNLGGGIYSTDSSPIIYSCTISENNGDRRTVCIYTADNSWPDISDNNICYNEYAIFNNDNSQILMAKENWWGDASGPYHPNFNPNGFR